MWTCMFAETLLPDSAFIPIFLSAVFHLWAVQEVAEVDPFVSWCGESYIQEHLNTLSLE